MSKEKDQDALYKQFVELAGKGAEMGFAPCEFTYMITCFLTSMMLDTDHGKEMIEETLKIGLKAGVEAHEEEDDETTDDVKANVQEILNILCKEKMIMVFNPETKRVENAVSVCMNGDAIQINLGKADV